MDGREILEARLLGRKNVVLDTKCYYCVYVLHILYSVIVPMVLCAYCICSDGYRWWYVRVAYAVMCTYCTMHMMDMQCFVHIVLCA